MFQQGQVFKLKAKSIDGQPLWAYRYRLEGPDSARPQVGGFATRGEALRQIRSNAGASAGAEPGGRLGADRLQPGQAGRPEPRAAIEGEAAVRIVGADRGGRRPARLGLFPNSRGGRIDFRSFGRRH